MDNPALTTRSCLPVALLTLLAPLPTCVEGPALQVKSTGSGWPTHASAGQRHGCRVKGCAACKPVCPSTHGRKCADAWAIPSCIHLPYTQQNDFSKK